MCGLVGWVGRRLGADTEGYVARALRSLAHRGPDASSVQRVDGPLTAVLGSSRLRILDLSPAGDVPMSTVDGMMRLAYNGDIYNHHELRQGLVARGHHFWSTTDTECLLHLYEELADDVEQFLRRLRGMFAIAIWDSRRQRLLLARDRLGIKPLTYAPTPGAMAFSSEARGLVTSGLDAVREAILSDDLPLGEFLHPTGRRQVWDAYQAGRTDWRGPWALAVLRMGPAANGLSWS
jgi:asparagine synthase (glutamine-hydrolysing)